MEFIKENITFVIATFTLVSNIVFVLLVLAMVFDKDLRKWIYDFVDKYVLSLLLVTTLGALVGSLAYSDIAGFPPCELCWIQRIFMYPQTLLVFVAMIKKEKSIVDYLLPLSILGALVAVYHSMTNLGVGPSLLGCTAVGGECSKLLVLEYGYITIPFMALTTFVYLIAISVVYYRAQKAKVF